LVAAFRRLGRLLPAAPVDVVKPAMIEAAQPAVLDPAVAEIGAAMRAIESKQAEAVTIVAKQHQLLAEDLDRHWRPAGRKLVGKRDRLPVAAHQRPAWRVRTGERDEAGFFFGQYQSSSCPSLR